MNAKYRESQRKLLRAAAICLVAFLLLGTMCFGQTTVTRTQQLNVAPFNAAPQVTGATAVSDFETGTTSYFYWIVTHQAGQVSAPVLTVDHKGPASLSSANGSRITVSWNQIPNATYDVLETASSSLPASANCGCAVATGVTASSVVDIGTYTSYATNQMPGFDWQITSQLDGGVPTLQFYYNGDIPCTMTPLSVTCGGGGKPAEADGLYYVSAEGSDANDCLSWNTACATVAGAESKLAAGTGDEGGVISVGGGSFVGSFTLSVPTMLVCNAVYGSALESNGTSAAIATITADGSRITQCAFDGGRTAAEDILITQDVSDIELDHNDIQNATVAGIQFSQGGSRVNVRDNFLSGNGTGSTGYQISYVEPATQTDAGVLIVNNNMDSTDYADSCVSVVATPTNSMPATQINGLRITGNTCSLGGSSSYSTQGVMISADTSGAHELIPGAVISGNTIYSTTQGAVEAVVQSSPNGGQMQPAGTNTGTMTVTAATDINIGDTGQVVVDIVQNSPTPVHVSTVTDSLGNIWTVDAQQDFRALNFSGDTWTLALVTAPMGTHVAPGGTFTVTVTLTGSAYQFFAGFGDVSGVGSFINAVSASWNGTSGTYLQTFTGGAVTGSVLLSAAVANETITGNPSGPPTRIFIGTSGGENWQGWASALPSGSSSPTWSQAGADSWVAINAAFSAKMGPTEAVAILLNGNVQGASVTANTTRNLAGVSLTEAVADAAITGNAFTGAGAQSGGPGVSISSSSKNLVDSNTFAEYTGSASGAIGIDILNSGATSNCYGVNVFDSVTTPIADAGTTTGCPNNGAGGGGGVSSVSKICTMSADVSVTASTLTPVLPCSITMPASGGPFRVSVSYNIYVASSNSIADSYVTDGTNIFASNEVESSAGFHTSNNGAGLSQGSYANGANVTFTVEMECGSNSTAKAAPTQVGQNSWISIVVQGAD
jgi:hypothetical protein